MKLTRNKSVLSEDSALQLVYCLPKMPVHFGCVSSDITDDIFLDQKFVICKETGIIQILDFPTVDLLYLTRHNDAIGKIWNDLFNTILSIINDEFSSRTGLRILEIGAGSGKLAKKILDEMDVVEYIICEPNPSPDLNDNKNIQVIKGYYDEDIVPKNSYDLILHSHVIEHADDPVGFINSVSQQVNEDMLHIFVVPHLKETFSKKYTNALNFEHTFFMTEDYIDVLLNNAKLEILRKEYFLDHSIIYVTQLNKSLRPLPIPNLYEEHSAMLLQFINYHRKFVADVNDRLKNFEGDIFLFGAHIFSQYLIGFGLEVKRISGILDNSPIKIGKRLYGTDLWVQHPSVIRQKKCAIILKAATYQDEIKKQLLQINSRCIIIE